MAVKQFPQDFPDITASANKVIGSKPDGTLGSVNVRPGGATLSDVAANGNTTPNNIIVTNGNTGASLQSNDGDSVVNVSEIRSTGARWTLGSNIGFVNPINDRRLNFNYFTGTAWKNLGALDNNGNLNVVGSVNGTVFNPVSLRSKKTNIKDYNGNALEQINLLKLHTYHFREFKDVELEAAEFDEEGNLIRVGKIKKVEVEPTNQQLNVGVIIDEINNPLIADQEKGVLNLNNIVFLQAKAIQQLTARLEALEGK